MRYVYLILFAGVLGLPFLLRTLAVHDPQPHAGPEALRLVVVTPHNGDIRREFARAFDDWYRARYGRGAIIDYRVPGGSTDLVHLVSSSYQVYRNPDGSLPPDVRVGLDMVWGGGDFTFYHDLQPLGVLQPIRLPPNVLTDVFPQDSLAGVRLYDGTRDPAGMPTPKWIGICLSSFGIVYNPQLYRTLDLPAPQQWADLGRPQLFGLVALADPAHSGSAAVSYMMVLQRAMADAEQDLLRRQPDLKALKPAELKKRDDYRKAIAAGWHKGMGQLLLIAANARYFTDSAEMVPTDVGRGEAAAGMAIDFYARVTEETVGSDRARFVSPFAATAITPDAIAVLHGVRGEQLTLANRFIEFLLAPEAQRLWILQPNVPGGPLQRGLRRMPIRRDVYANQTGWADHFNPFDEAGGFNQRGEWMATLTDIRPIWDAAWIDSRDALIDAYRAVLSVPDANRRAALLERLADVPIQLTDVEADRAERTRLDKSHGDVDEWRARRRIEWAQRFRAHARSVADQAR